MPQYRNTFLRGRPSDQCHTASCSILEFQAYAEHITEARPRRASVHGEQLYSLQTRATHRKTQCSAPPVVPSVRR